MLSITRRIAIASATVLGLAGLTAPAFAGTANDGMTLSGTIDSTVNISITDASKDLTTNVAASTPSTYKVKLSDISQMGSNDADGYQVVASSTNMSGNSGQLNSADGDDQIPFKLAIAVNTDNGQALTYKDVNGTTVLYTGVQGNVTDQALFISVTQADADTADAGAYADTITLTISDL